MKRHANTIKAIEDRGLTVGQEIAVDSADHDKQSNSGRIVNEWGLTAKQEAYAQGVAKGQTLRDAYCLAYDASNMATTSIYSEASKLMDRPLIAQRIKALIELRSTKSHAIDAMRVRQHVFDRLMEESVNSENPAAARIRALENLGNIDVVSMFKKQVGPALQEEADPKLLEAKLREMLTTMFGIAPPAKG